MPPEVVFIIILIIVSMLEGAVRNRRARKGGGTGTPLPPGWPEPGDFPGAEDDGADVPEWEREGVQGQVPGQPRPRPQGQRQSAEGMVPKELWEEIARLARGEPPRQLDPKPEPVAEPTATAEPPVVTQPPRPDPKRSRRTLSTEPESISGQLESRRPLSAGSDLTRREAPKTVAKRAETRPAPSDPHKGIVAATSPLPERARAPHEDDAYAISSGRTKRRAAETDDSTSEWLRSAGALRRAIIAREVLGPPLALRDDETDVG